MKFKSCQEEVLHLEKLTRDALTLMPDLPLVDMMRDALLRLPDDLMRRHFCLQFAEELKSQLNEEFSND
jgi:hypothetical protein